MICTQRKCCNSLSRSLTLVESSAACNDMCVMSVLPFHVSLKNMV